MKKKIIKKLLGVDLNFLQDGFKLQIDKMEKQLEKMEKENNLLREKVHILQNLAIHGLEGFEVNFDVRYDDSSREWVVITEYCQIGGCELGGMHFHSEQEARRKAIELTLDRVSPKSSQACSRCYAELKDENVYTA